MGNGKIKQFAAMALLMRNRQFFNTFIAVAYINFVAVVAISKYKWHKVTVSSIAECDP